MHSVGYMLQHKAKKACKGCIDQGVGETTESQEMDVHTVYLEDVRLESRPGVVAGRQQQLVSKCGQQLVSKQGQQVTGESGRWVGLELQDTARHERQGESPVVERSVRL